MSASPSASPLHGSLSYIEAHQWLKRTGRLKWLLWPLLCSLLLLPVYGYAVYYTTTGSLSWVINYFHWQAHGIAYWLMLPFILLAALFAGYILLKNIIMLLCVPLNALLADSVMTEQLGAQAQNGKELALSMLRATVMTIFTLLLTLITGIALLLLGFIPVAGAAIALVLGIILQAFFAAWGFFDPVFERANCGIMASFWRCIRLFPHTVSNGIPFVLLFQIPVLGWTLAPSYGAISGALYACQLHKQGKLLSSSP